MLPPTSRSLVTTLRKLGQSGVIQLTVVFIMHGPSYFLGINHVAYHSLVCTIANSKSVDKTAADQEEQTIATNPEHNRQILTSVHLTPKYLLRTTVDSLSTRAMQSSSHSPSHLSRKPDPSSKTLFPLASSFLIFSFSIHPSHPQPQQQTNPSLPSSLPRPHRTPPHLIKQTKRACMRAYTPVGLRMN